MFELVYVFIDIFGLNDKLREQTCNSKIHRTMSKSSDPQEIMSIRVIWSRIEVHKVDALASGGDEGRSSLR